MGRGIAVSAILGCLGCSDLFGSGFPSSAKRFAPSGQFQVWWSIVENCSGATAPYDAVEWYTVPHSSDFGSKDATTGAWYPDGNRIVLLDAKREHGRLVRHEMLHAITGIVEHPPDYFEGRCADEVECGRECVEGAAPAGAVRKSLSEIGIATMVFLPPPSLSRNEGWVSVAISVTNPWPTPIELPMGLSHETGCRLGYRITSLSGAQLLAVDCDPLNDARAEGLIYLQAGETRRGVFDLNLRTPPLGTPFVPGPVRLSAVVRDITRATTTLVVIP